MYFFLLAYKITVLLTINSILSLVENSRYNDYINTLRTDAFLTVVTIHLLTHFH